MNCSLYWKLLAILLLQLATKSNSAPCGGVGVSMRRTTSNNLANDESDPQMTPQIDLSQLSETQLQQLMQQLNVADQFDEEDNRGNSRPWNKIQRILKRQLIRIPKRYLKKLLRQFGLARSVTVRSGTIELQPQVNFNPNPQSQQYYLIPLE